MYDPAETVPCPLCFAVVGAHCLRPRGDAASTSHRARILLSIVGVKNAQAAAVVEAAVSVGELRSEVARRQQAINAAKRAELRGMRTKAMDAELTSGEGPSE